MTKKTEVEPTQRYNKHSIETILNVSLCVPMTGDPADPDVIMGMPVLFWGAPGIGKSSRTKAASRRLGIGCSVLFPATLQPEDVTGVLVPDGKGGATKICMLEAVRNAVAAKTHTIFIDEISGAAPATQGALAGAVLDRQFGDIMLPGKVRIVAAANPPEQAAGGYELDAMFANRFAHFEVYPPTAEEWVDYMLSQNVPRDTSILDYEEIVQKNWEKAYAKSLGLFAGFQKKTSGKFLHRLPPEGSQDRSRAWASPRTWEGATRVAATCMALDSVVPNSGDLMLDFIAACVGSGAAGEFTTWLREANLPNPEDVLNNGWTPDRLRLDRNYAVYTAMSAFITGTKDEAKRLKYAVQGWDILNTASDAGLKDMIAPIVSQLVNRGLSVGMVNSPDPAKKKVGVAAARVMTKIGKTKIGAMAHDFKDPQA